MEIPAKERLVGAAVLVTLIVLLVPELLSGPNHPQSAPAPERGDPSAVRSFTIDLSAPAGSAATADASSNEDITPTPGATILPPPPATNDPNTPVSSTVASGSSPAPIQSPPSSTTPATSPAQPPTQTAVPAAQPSQTTQIEKSEAPPEKPAKQESKPPADSGAWAVQLGSFSSRDNAERLVKDLKGRGYSAFISRIGSSTKTRYRVRIGPEAARVKADSLAARLRKEGRQATVVPNS